MSEKLQGLIRLFAPVYLLEARQRCYMCQALAPVYCLAAEGFAEADFEAQEFTLFSNLVAMPRPLERLLRKKARLYYLDYSKQRSNCYFINHCSCGAKLSEYALHNDADGAFNPASASAAEAISRHPLTLDLDEPLMIDATVVLQDTDPIQKNARLLAE